jgi:hypothetical protein
VLLRAGTWEFEQTNQSDSLVSVYCEDVEVVGPFGKSAIAVLEQNTEVHAVIHKAGSESFINVFAVKHN